MIRSRSITLTAAACVGLLAFAGCAKKNKIPEQRLGVDAFGKSLDGMMADGMGADGLGGPGGGFNGAGWEPGSGAPGEFGAGGGVNSSMVDVASFTPDDAAGGFSQSNDVMPFDAAIAELEMVHFNYDQADIKPEWQTVLEDHASWLNQNPGVHVQVEGHCDERGTEEYNLALGQRRADTIRNYLIDQGVQPDRVTTISYGKLRPLTFGSTEEEHALNRRGMFLVYSPGTEMAGF